MITKQKRLIDGDQSLKKYASLRSNKSGLKPAIPEVLSLQCSGLIWSYFGFEHDIKMILNLLCKSTVAYYKRNQSVLTALSIRWQPEIDQLIEFGRCDDKLYPWDSLPPSKDQLVGLPHEQAIRLTSINYKQFQNSGCLQGI